MTVLPIRLSPQDAKKIDLLVKLGIYQSRTEAIRAMIQDKADEQISRYILSKRVLLVLDKLLEYEKREGRNPLRISAKKTAAEIVAEARQ